MVFSIGMHKSGVHVYSMKEYNFALVPLEKLVFGFRNKSQLWGKSTSVCLLKLYYLLPFSKSKSQHGYGLPVHC